jgi:uncharacterized membrane protein YecN with MAPEG domain
MPLPVTALYAALLGLLFGVLTLLVVKGRIGSGVMLGTGEDRRLYRAVRAHANFAEFVPLALLLMALNEGLRVSSFLLHGLGIVLVLARVLHAIGLSREPDLRAGRGPGAVLTLAVIIVASLTLLSRALAALAILG